MPDHAQVLLHSVESYLTTKTARCKQQGGPHDLAPMLDLRFEEPDGWVQTMCTVDDESHLTAAFLGMIAIHSRAALRFVCILSDAVCRMAPLEFAPLMANGSLLAMRDEGDLSVFDVLVIAVIDVSDRSVMQVVVPYVYDDQGQPDFGRPLREQMYYDGPLPTLLGLLDLDL